MAVFSEFFLVVLVLIGVISQRIFCNSIKEEKSACENLLNKYFWLEDPAFELFRLSFKSGTLGIHEKSIVWKMVMLVSRPINSWAPSPSVYMDTLEYRIRNLRSYRVQDCIIRILLICGILWTMVFFAAKTNNLTAGSLYSTAASGFKISALGIAFAVVLIFVRYIYVEKAFNGFSRKCEELIVTGLIPSFHKPSNNVLKKAVNDFASQIGEMRESFSSLKTALQSISLTQSSANDSMESHVRGLKDITRDFSELSVAIKSVTHKDGSFVSLLEQVQQSQKEFAAAIKEMLPQHRMELGEMKQAVTDAAASQNRFANSIANTVSEANGNQAQVLEKALAEISNALTYNGKSNREVLEDVAVRLGQICNSVSKSVREDHVYLQNTVKTALDGMGEMLKEHTQTQQSNQNEALGDIAKTLKVHADVQQAIQNKVFAKIDASTDACKELVSEASLSLSGSSKEFAERISSALVGEMKELSGIVGGIVSALHAVDDSQREYLASLLSEKLARIETRLSEVATVSAVNLVRDSLLSLATKESVSGLQASVASLATKESVGRLQASVESLATNDSLAALQTKVESLASEESVKSLHERVGNLAATADLNALHNDVRALTTKDELEQSVVAELKGVQELVIGQGKTLGELQKSSVGLSGLAKNADKLIAIGSEMSVIRGALKEISDNAQKAANKKGFNW